MIKNVLNIILLDGIIDKLTFSKLLEVKYDISIMIFMNFINADT